VLRVPHEQKTNSLAALRTWGKRLARDASHLVRIGVLAVVDDRVNSRFFHCVARLGRTGHSILFSTESAYFALRVAQTQAMHPKTVTRSNTGYWDTSPPPGL